jgi:hypothetical protein
MPGAGSSEGCEGKAPSDMPALKPYWGKPTVRNFRGGYGNGGIIRSPLSAMTLLDCRKGSSESILTSSLAGDIARCHLKRRQRHWWAGRLSFEKAEEQDADSIP